MFRPLPLIVILAVLLGSIGLGAARGTIRIGERIVLCTGHGVIVVDRPDGQGDTLRLCPDMALSLMAAVAPADVVLPRRQGTSRRLVHARGRSSRPWIWTQVRARDPPSPLAVPTQISTDFQGYRHEDADFRRRPGPDPRGRPGP